jgi:hypothetical protein
MNKTTLLTLVLAVLVIVSAVQAVQLTTLKSKLADNDVKTTTSSPTVKSSGGEVSTPKSLDNLPQMVGGC